MRARRVETLALVALALASAALVGPLDAQITDRARLVAALDSAARAHAADSMIAGVSVAVVRGADTLLMRGYGYVDLEWDVPTPEDASASYEIGSITKQFTAAAVLELVEEGKIDLDADVTHYLPEFDTQGHALPVRRLLDHTSGMKGMTEMAIFRDEIGIHDLPRDTLLALVGAEPFQFAPGHGQIYNNSAYFLLGLIIERTSGQSYESFIEQHVFGALGMDDSYYCSESAIRPRRAHGYDAGPDGLRRKDYLDHTWPYAAGSLCSTVGDLVRWNQTLHGGRSFLEPGSYRAMITPQPLADGTTTNYAMGIAVFDRGEHTMITHNGGINGFLSDARYVPEEDLVIVVLQNTATQPGPGALTAALTDLVLGPFEPEPPVATPFGGDLDTLVGTYRGPGRGPDAVFEITRDGDELLVRPSNAPEPVALVHVDGLTWARGATRFTFLEQEGRVAVIRVRSGGGVLYLERQEG